jgi:hypothetical protein
VAHTYNPSYTGGSDQKDLSSKRPYLKKPYHKKIGLAQVESPEFKPQYHKKKKE